MGESIIPELKTATVWGCVPSDPDARQSGAKPTGRIGGRYLVQEELGRGGMAVVYRALDNISGRAIALKQLLISANHPGFAEHAAAFEREYHALVQLSHPRIIEVYDFGVDEGGRYYTMELLDGGDLREHAPLPWQEACALFYEVCSSLALLHSRQLVHRDISPRNIRRTRGGSAKLIDFGALVPLGMSAQLVGTPPFVPPEVLHRSTLDARTDLFSLGASLYFGLTGRLAYPARDFSKLQEVWRQRPAPPSTLVGDIPLGLDALVLSLISLDPAMRPRTAFEVMQKLAALAGFEHKEVVGVSRAYLSTPTLVGREGTVGALRLQIARAIEGSGRSTMLRGPQGIGRSRMLDVCALDAKLAGAVVLRVNAEGTDDAPLTVGQRLAAQLVEALPELAITSAQRRQVSEVLFEAAPADAHRAEADLKPVLKNLTGRGGDRAAIQSALTLWFTQAAKSQPMVVLVDDAQCADEASLALLAALALSAASRCLLVVCTARGAPSEQARAFDVLVRESKQLELPPLDREHTQALLGSVFGDVPKLALVSDRLYEASRGNPREALELVQWLIARDAIRYEGGQWLLPGELSVSELPSSAAEGCRQRVEQLSRPARLVGELLALASHPSLSRVEFGIALHDLPSADLDAAITELLSARVFACDGYAFTFAGREWSDALLGPLAEADRNARHRALAEVYGKDDGQCVERAHHLLAGGCHQAGLDLLRQLLSKTTADSQGLLALTKLRAEPLALLLERALTIAEASGCALRDIQDLRRGIFAISVLTDEAHYQRVAQPWFAQLRHDAGLDLYEAITDAANPGERIMRALKQAAARYAATPESERVYSPDVATRSLVHYVVVSIAYGSRTQDSALVASLPGILAPLAPLSPLIHAVWQNAIATRETLVDNLPERAHERWLKVLEALSNVSHAEVSYVGALRGAVRYGMGLIEARLGLPSAEERAKSLENEPLQQVSAVSLRRVARLHRGDAAGAERYRKQAEALALRVNLRQMFTSTLSAELIAHALASDLTGLREAAQAIEPLAARFPGWVPYKHLADGCFEQTCGRLDAARDAFERGLTLSEPDPADPGRPTGAWLRLESAYIELLVITERAASAKERGLRVLQTCAHYGIGLAAFPVRRALALAIAALGDYALASQYLDDVLRELSAREMRGLELGATYEARARIAIWFSDGSAIERYGRLIAEEYRYGEGSALGARYERLMDEARHRGVIVLPRLSEVPAHHTTARGPGIPTTVSIRELLATPTSVDERPARVLKLLCEVRGASSGHLYMHTGERLELVASHGEAAPNEALGDFVQRYVMEQLQMDAFSTSSVPRAQHDSSHAAWHPSSVVGVLQGVRVCLAAVVVEAPTRSIGDASWQQLLHDVSEYVLRSGPPARGSVASAQGSG